MKNFISGSSSGRGSQAGQTAQQQTPTKKESGENSVFLFIQYYFKTLTNKHSHINKLVYFKEKNNTEKDLKLNEF